MDVSGLGAAQTGDDGQRASIAAKKEFLPDSRSGQNSGSGLEAVAQSIVIAALQAALLSLAFPRFD
jgi:hypothetical protein